MTPFGFIEDGINNHIQSFVDESGDLWTYEQKDDLML